MTGLEKIVKQIETDAEERALFILGEAKAEAEALLEQARLEGLKRRDEILADGERTRENLMAVAESAESLQSRKELLLIKQKLIQETIGEAREALLAMPLTEYFGVLKKLIVQYALPKDGQLHLNANDLKRKPKTFEQEINAALKDKGGTLTISNETRLMDGGFILEYGGVEENGSFEALFESVQERLQDKVQAVLFA